jgi:hypothetical protein
LKEITNAIEAARVLSFRLPMLWAMALSPTPARRAEALRMIVEKQMAAVESVNAATLAAVMAWLELAGGQSVSAQKATEGILRAARRPGERRLKANARRLRRRRRI